MKETHTTMTSHPEKAPGAFCPNCHGHVHVLEAPSATCRSCGHRFPLVEPGEKGPHLSL